MAQRGQWLSYLAWGLLALTASGLGQEAVARRQPKSRSLLPLLCLGELAGRQGDDLSGLCCSCRRSPGTVVNYTCHPDRLELAKQKARWFV